MSGADVHVPAFLASAWEHRYWLASGIGSVFAAVIGWLHLTFPTHDDMADCKMELVAATNAAIKRHEIREEKKMDDYREADEIMHQSLREDITAIRADLAALTRALIK